MTDVVQAPVAWRSEPAEHSGKPFRTFRGTAPIGYTHDPPRLIIGLATYRPRDALTLAMNSLRCWFTRPSLVRLASVSRAQEHAGQTVPQGEPPPDTPTVDVDERGNASDIVP
jgi:hypothetical protein